MSSSEWSKELLIDFINCYKQYNCLWQLKSKDYTNRNLKNRAYVRLVELVQPHFPSANTDFVKSKIQNLRNAFRKEMKKVEASKRSGRSTDEIYEPTLWYYDYLLFTKDQDTPLSSVSNLSPEMFNEDNENNEFDSNYVNSSIGIGENSIEPTNEQVFKSPVVPIQKSKKRKRDENVSEFMKTCASALSSVSEQLDEYDAIAVNIAAKLKKMNPTQQILAESLFQKIIKKGLFNQLTEYTDVNEILNEVPHPQSTNIYHYDTNRPDFDNHPISSNSDSSLTSQISHYYEEAGRGGLDV